MRQGDSRIWAKAERLLVTVFLWESCMEAVRVGTVVLKRLRFWAR